MQPNIVTNLNWDSDFFGFNIGSITIHNQKDYDNYRSLNHKEFKLIYLFANEAVSITDSNCLLADTKVTFEKNVADNDLQLNSNIVIVNQAMATEHYPELLQLALLAGTYSRFRVDNQFPQGSYERLYQQWLDNAINGKFGNLILGYFNRNTLVGFVTVNITKTNASIGLIAVNPNHAGKGIGKQLMQAAEYYAQKNNIPTISVVTQFQNKPACALYHSLDYQISQKMAIYHHWLS